VTRYGEKVQWTRQTLVSLGQLDKSQRGIWAITPQGRDRLEREWDGWSLDSTSRNVKRAVELSLREGLVDDETKLYAPVRDWLDKNWGKDARDDKDEYWAKITATKARGGQPGKWSRPDVTSVQVRRFDILPQRSVEVITFEVKQYEDAKDVESVYEAASHQRWGHYSYLVAEMPVSTSEPPEDVMSEARAIWGWCIDFQNAREGQGTHN
jgi:hypothetical protein